MAIKPEFISPIVPNATLDAVCAEIMRQFKGT